MIAIGDRVQDRTGKCYKVIEVYESSVVGFPWDNARVVPTSGRALVLQTEKLTNITIGENNDQPGN